MNHAGYRCTKCGAERCKLFRQYQTFADHVRLLCVSCAQSDQKCMYNPNESKHALGWLVAAVPTEEGDTFWGYTSVPDAGVKWWDDLPLFAPAAPAPGEEGT